MPRPTAADAVATEVAERLEQLATLAADAILDSLYAPQVVDPTTDKALAYWETILMPGGVFDPAGRDRVVQQVGAPEYRSVAQALARKITREHADGTRPPPVPPGLVAPPPPQPPPQPPLPEVA